MSRFASCSQGERRFAALVEGDTLRPLEGITELGGETPSEVLADPPLSDERIPLADVTLLPVVPHPGKVICVGLNYKAHVEEGVYEVPDYPALFSKFADTLVGAGAPVLLPPESEAVDYEAELAFVVGRAVRRASGDEALAAVGGYTLANDVSMRDYQYKTHQWLPGKNWAGSTPLGPYPGDARRGRRPARARHLARAQRRAHAGVQHVEVHLRHPDAGGDDLRVHPAQRPATSC